MSFGPYLALAAIFFTLGAPARAEDNPILQRMAAFIEAYNAGDAAAISGFYTDKGALLPPMAGALVGRQAIGAHYAKAFAQGVGGLTYRVLEIEQAGADTAVEIGETTVQLGQKTISGRSMHVWKKIDGVWSLHRDIYHVLAVRE